MSERLGVSIFVGNYNDRGPGCGRYAWWNTTSPIKWLFDGQIGLWVDR